MSALGWLNLIGSTLFVLVLLVLALPICVFVGEVLLALLSRRVPAATAAAGTRAPLAVLIPAHNEGAAILATLASVRTQLLAGDRLLVVADNCSDDTAAQARGAGAEVLVREDLVRRGKGYALDAGVRHLAHNPPALVVVVDADCMLGPDTLEHLARSAMASGRPVQSLDLMRAPANAGLKTRIAEFAWAVKNHARALGMTQLGLPCQLMGTGMAFPWALIEGAALATGDLVEDLRLGLDFARAGHAPVFCPAALVTSEFPVNATGLDSQRTRWEHGHLAMMLRVPGLLWEAIRSGNLGLFALTLDLCVPPLALLVLVSLAFGAVGAVLWAVTGAALPWALALAGPLLLGVAVMGAWLRFGRTILSARELAYAPIYALVKIPLYLKFVVQRQVAWVRSERDPS